jgi:hypothetical protein
MWKANGKTTTLQLFLDSLSKNTQIGRGYGPVETEMDYLLSAYSGEMPFFCDV